MEIGDEENQEEVDSDLEEDDDDEEDAGDSSDDEPAVEKTFIPGTKTEECDGELEVDENAYILYHQVMLARLLLFRYYFMLIYRPVWDLHVFPLI